MPVINTNRPQVVNPTGATSPAAATQPVANAVVDAMSSATPPAAALAPAKAAVAQMRELVRTNGLRAYYDAITGVKDDPALKDKAMKLFAALPKVNQSTTAEAMVAVGLWTTAPRGVAKALAQPRYVPGRQVLVKTTVHNDAFDTRSFLSYKQGGEEAVTYRASLAGEKGDKFLVKVDGRDAPIEVDKKAIYELNQPHEFVGDKLNLGGKQCDYDSPLVKAKIAEAALKMDTLVGKLDFDNTNASSGILAGLFGRGSNKSPTEIQRKCLRVIHDVVNMRYPNYSSGSRDATRPSGRDVGRQAIRGLGVCNEQSAVLLGLLIPFRHLLAFDVESMNGGNYRHLKRGYTGSPFRGGGHSWLQITYRPSMELRICDRTWQQPDHPADKAYSRWGDRYPSGRGWGMDTQKLRDIDVDMSGRVKLEKGARIFGAQGVDGRDNHISVNPPADS